MKRIFLSVLFVTLITSVYSQNFKTSIATAKTSYAAGKLEDTHFALQQMLQELDVTIGKEVLKLLPPKMDVLEQNTADDNVTGNVGFIGATIHRSYGKGDKTAKVEIINNSPLISTLNTFLTSPLLAGLGSNGNSKVIKVQGYKGRLTREEGENGKSDYRLEIPYSNALVTVNVNNTSESEIVAMANSIPLEKIGKLIQ
ncbi:hypothetical protein EXU57_02815 [Segetibacter sp. 3557_3]|uniref:hypothetical protein n=1 Tax=Segetibacter sp. 3557_3 TaxID=2547429 RepID=UPI001058BF72|nr:hypothetical protein [Segetibacter sp. 3557_3]TDH29023.1 hypothetical protein EXU57_02815 [Segetibacter sp. 3557_3]